MQGTTIVTPNTRNASSMSAATDDTCTDDFLNRKRKADEMLESPPFHVLMLDSSMDSVTSSELNNHKRKILISDRRFKNDYLSMRYRAFQDANLIKQNDASTAPEQRDESNDPDKWWSGATSVERSLASCCTLHPDDYLLSGESLPQNSRNSNNTSNHSTRRQQKYSPANNLEEDTVAGALSTDKITKFVGILAMNCHDIGSRALALAILEQSQEADEIEMMDHYSYVSTPPPVLSNKNDSHKESDPISSLTKNTTRFETNFESSEPLMSETPALNSMQSISGLKSSENMTAKSTESNTNPSSYSASFFISDNTDSFNETYQVSHKKPERLTQFLRAGGLKILSQWLVDATRPVVEIHKKSSARRKGSDSNVAGISNVTKSSSTKVIKSSPTGPIVLPLLQFLHNIPFDLEAITQSRINKEIKKIRKQIDSRVEEQKKKIFGDDDEKIGIMQTDIKPFSDPVAGGLDVLEVQAALKKLMQIWETQAKQEKIKLKIVPKRQFDDAKNKNPFALVIDRIKTRLSELQAYEGASSNDVKRGKDTPEWLQKFLQKQQNNASKSNSGVVGSSSASNPGRSNQSHMSEMARRERENERSAIMKQDLEKAQEERRQLLRKLRQLQQQSSNPKEIFNTTDQDAIITSTSNTKRQNVKWKDGYGSVAKSSTYGVLEEVFLFHKDHAVRPELSMVAAEVVNQSETRESMNEKDLSKQALTSEEPQEGDYDSETDELEELFG